MLRGCKRIQISSYYYGLCVWNDLILEADKCKTFHVVVGFKKCCMFWFTLNLFSFNTQNFFFFFPLDEIKFGVNRLMEKPESEDEDAGVYRAKSLITCDSPSNLSVTRTKSRSRSRSHSRSRSSSSSSDLEVDSPPPPRITISPLTDIQQHVRRMNEKKLMKHLNSKLSLLSRQRSLNHSQFQHYCEMINQKHQNHQHRATTHSKI